MSHDSKPDVLITLCIYTFPFFKKVFTRYETSNGVMPDVSVLEIHLRLKTKTLMKVPRESVNHTWKILSEVQEKPTLPTFISLSWQATAKKNHGQHKTCKVLLVTSQVKRLIYLVWCFICFFVFYPPAKSLFLFFLFVMEKIWKCRLALLVSDGKVIICYWCISVWLQLSDRIRYEFL